MIFLFQFRNIITRYGRIGYNLNVMQESVCLVFNPIIGSTGDLFICSGFK